jgi:hypothetical protein
MSLTLDRDDLPAILARAFVQAWQSYYLPGRCDTISEETARPALARYLVAKAKEGVKEEVTLAAAGLRHLNLLTPEPHRSSDVSLPGMGEFADEPASDLARFNSRSLHFRFNGLNAKFLPQWRIPWSRST